MKRWMAKAARKFYGPILALFGIYYLPHLLVRLKQAGDRKKMLAEKWGRPPDFFRGKRVLWVHAVSVGEVMAAREFLRLVQIVHPNLTIALSTTTPTGQAVAKKMENEQIHVFYFPLDFSWVIRRALDRIQPGCIVIMETEIWPNLIETASLRGIPIGIINGRISKRTLKRYLFLKDWFSVLLRKMSFCLVCTEEDCERFVAIGAEEGRVHVTGNMKFDIEARRNPIESENLRARWGLEGGLVWVGGSTHEKEEEILIRLFKKLRADFPSLKLILAPRHPERAGGVMDLVEKAGLAGVFASKPTEKKPDVLVLDMMGELSRYYGAADVVFVGGSLIPHGGQNPIEPAQERRAILHGPHVFNFQELYGRLDDLGGAVRVADEGDLLRQMNSLLGDRGRRQTIGSRAFEVVDGLKGATQRNLMFLERWLSHL